MEARITDKIKVQHSVRPEVGREFLTIDCRNGWEDVDKIRKRVLEFDGREFVFSGWNSDTNQCYFFRPLVTLGGEIHTAKFVK